MNIDIDKNNPVLFSTLTEPITFQPITSKVLVQIQFTNE